MRHACTWATANGEKWNKSGCITSEIVMDSVCGYPIGEPEVVLFYDGDVRSAFSELFWLCKAIND